jgi:ATP-dependent DNA helicase RecQ
MAYGLGDAVQQRRLIEASEGDEAFRRIASAKLDALLGLCETAGCRRVRLLEYFGESARPCGNCDTCLAPPLTWDATEAARMALSAIYRTGQRFGAVHLIDVLRGRDTERVTRWRHQELSVFGIGAGLDESTWRSVFRQLVALGLARPDHGRHGALQLTDASRPVLKGEQSIELRRVAPRRSRRERTRILARGDADLAGADGMLVRLKAWRAEQARAQAVPAYVIFHDSTLAAIAAATPGDLTALARIPGIGAKKLERYGNELLNIVGDADG